MSDFAARPVHNDPRRRRLAIAVIVVFILGAMFLWSGGHPVEAFVAFDVPPTVRAVDGSGLKRAQLVRLRGTVRDDDGHPAASLDMTLAGLATPFTPPAVLRLPGGRYTVDVILTSVDGRFATMQATLELEEDGASIRAELRPPARPGA